MQQDFDAYHFIFTDGSKGGDRVSSAVFIPEHNDALLTRLPDDSSVYVAELYAIKKALEFVAERHWERIMICTDSRAVVLSLQQTSPSSPLLIQVFNVLHTLTTNDTRIHFLWVPGHCGIPGNTQADNYAKQALNLPQIIDLPTDYHSMKSSLRRAVMKAWQQQWTAIPRYTQLRQIKPGIEAWPTAQRTNRHEEKVLARLRLGHTFYTHRYILSREPRPVCPRCDCLLTVTHFIIDCPIYDIERRPLLDACNRHQLPFTLEQVLGDSNASLLDLLFAFLRRIKLFDKL